MTRLLAAAIVVATSILILEAFRQCRRSPALAAHDPGSEYDRFAFAGCQPCDPRTDELQAWASLYERPV